MNHALVISLPLLVPLVSGILCLFFPSRVGVQKIVGLTGNTLGLLAATWLFQTVQQEGILTSQFGGWPAPFGISFVADTLSATLVWIAALVTLVVSIYATVSVSTLLYRSYYVSLTQFMVMGVTGAFLTGDFFNLYVWFEVFLISSFALLSMGASRAQLTSTTKYVALNLIGSTVFLFAAGLLYNSAGTLNMADVFQELQRYRNPELIRLVPLLFIFAFGLKAAIFPLGNWISAAYPAPEFATTALFAALLTKVGVYSLLRTFSTVFSNEIYFTHDLLIWLGVVTMVTGVLGAAVQWNIRRILSVHIISQVGYMIFALALATPLGLGASFYFMVHNILVKTSLFLIAGYICRRYATEDIRELGGVFQRDRAVSWFFLFAALSLAGLPPLSGFWGKLFIAKAAVEIGFFWGLFISFGVSALTLYSMMKIWTEVFWKKASLPVPKRIARVERMKWLLPISILTAMSLWMGLFPETALQITERVGKELSQPLLYQEAVLRVAEVTR